MSAPKKKEAQRELGLETTMLVSLGAVMAAEEADVVAAALGAPPVTAPAGLLVLALLVRLRAR